MPRDGSHHDRRSSPRRPIQTGDRGHEFIVDPQTTHGVVRRRVDAHRHLVWILAGDALVHVEEVAVPLSDHALAEATDGVGKIEVHTVLLGPNSLPGVHGTLCRTGRDVSGCEVAKARIEPLQVVVALVLGNEVRGAIVTGVLRHPDPAVITKRLGHEREL